MAESKNKLKGNRSKKPLIITFVIIGLIVWLFILYGSYAYLGYVRTNNIENPGMNEVLKSVETLFTADSFKLPLTGDVIKDIFVMQYKDLWWVYVGIAVLIILKLSISLDTITSKKRAVHRFRAGGKSSHRRRRLALGRF